MKMTDKSEGKRSSHVKKGTHGSLSKAGKMREQSPINWKARGHKRYHVKKHKSPKVANRRKHKNRIVLKKSGNTQKLGVGD